MLFYSSLLAHILQSSHPHSHRLWRRANIKNRLWLFCTSVPYFFFFFCLLLLLLPLEKRKSQPSSHMMFVWIYSFFFYLLCVIKLLSWSFIHLINNGALEVERRDPVFICAHCRAQTCTLLHTHTYKHIRSHN